MLALTWTSLRAGALALVLGATGLVAAPAPAQADSDAARAIVGIVALGLIARSLDDDKPKAAHRHHRPQVAQRVHRPHVHHHSRPRYVVRQHRPRHQSYRYSRPRYQHYRY